MFIFVWKRFVRLESVDTGWRSTTIDDTNTNNEQFDNRRKKTRTSNATSDTSTTNDCNGFVISSNRIPKEKERKWRGFFLLTCRSSFSSLIEIYAFLSSRCFVSHFSSKSFVFIFQNRTFSFCRKKNKYFNSEFIKMFLFVFVQKNLQSLRVPFSTPFENYWKFSSFSFLFSFSSQW